MTKPKKKPAKKPTLAQLLAKAFIDNMDRPLPLTPNYFDLDNALVARGNADMDGLIEDIFRNCIIFDTRFLMRAQFLSARLLKDWDYEMKRNPRAPMPEALQHEVLPRLERIERHIQNLVRDYAQVRHTLSLSDGANADREAVYQLAVTLRRLARVNVSPVQPAPPEQAPDQAKTEPLNEDTKDHDTNNPPDAAAPAA
jgi:hypothetical protein